MPNETGRSDLVVPTPKEWESYLAAFETSRTGHDAVNHPKHYTSHPSGIECIQVTEHMNFNVGNAVKYLWRCDEKGAHLEDLKKAAWYVQREIDRRTRAQEVPA